MKDQYERTIDYLRISVTDRCNLRCRYCMPEEGVDFLPHKDILTFEEIRRLAEIFARSGVTKIKITGGEPLVRRGIEDLIPMLAEIEGIEELTLTTNGIRDDLLLNLSEYFTGINISLDTLDPEKFKQMSRGGEIRHPLRALEELLKRGHGNIKVNTVPIRGFNEDELTDFARLAKDRDLKVRFIELMPIGEGRRYHAPTEGEIRETLSGEFGTPIPLEYRSNGPAAYFTYPGFTGALGFIRGVDHRFCHQCNRVRLTSTGFLKTCLGFDVGADLRKLLRGRGTDEEIQAAIKEALEHKPLENRFDRESGEEIRTMNQIGG